MHQNQLVHSQHLELGQRLITPNFLQFLPLAASNPKANFCCPLLQLSQIFI